MSEMGKHRPRVSIIVLNWNGLEDTVECLESLKKITYPNHDIIVVDNGSSGDDAQVLAARFGDQVHLIRNDRNYGYAGGNNIGIKYALENSTPDYVLVLNNDTTVAPDFLDHLVGAAESNAATGIVGPKVYYHHFPGRIQGAGGKVNMWTGRASLIGFKRVDIGQYDVQQEVDYIFGCCLLVNKEIVQKVGLFDEDYFSYWEETDYCFRAREEGYKIVYVPKARIWHKAPLQLSLRDNAPTSGRASGLSYYYLARNNVRFMRRHATRAHYISFLLCFFGYYLWLVTAVCLLYHRDIRQLVGFYRGVIDALLNSGDGRYTKD